MPPAPAAFAPLLGRQVVLVVQRFGSAGAFLGERGATERDAPTLLLLGAEIPAGARLGDELSVFVYLDSEGRPLATTRAPMLELDEVRFLTVSALTEFGAFVDWGMPKELLVPFSEQTMDLRVGARHPIGLYLDKSGRLAGTMRVSEMLTASLELEPEQWVDGEAYRNDPEIGLFVIVDRRGVGLVPRSEPHRLTRGQLARFRVTSVLEDGKVELSLRAHAHEELEGDAERVLALLQRSGAPRVGDRSPPEQIRALFGLSKKAFKRAVGRLLKQAAVELDGEGWVVARAAPAPRER